MLNMLNTLITKREPLDASVGVRLTTNQVDRIDRIAADNNVSRGEVIRTLITVAFNHVGES